MNITLKLEGYPEDVINQMISNGIATNKTEAIRLAIMDYNEHHKIKRFSEEELDELAVKKMQQIDKEIEEGKRRVLKMKDILKKYPHLRDV